ncbi:MAG: ferritin-like domain-containing protein, partial [Patulibacter sp.]|nr:ferritin-like domain-containing protein [Patulibacter sp.]
MQPTSASTPPPNPPIDPAPPGDSRRGFLRAAGLTGAAGATALFLAACGDDDDSSTTSASTPSTTTTMAGAEGDLAILNYALTLEYLEADFYAKVEQADLFKGDELDLVKRFGAAEQEHVDALKATIEKLGGTAVA